MFASIETAAIPQSVFVIWRVRRTVASVRVARDRLGGGASMNDSAHLKNCDQIDSPARGI
jgi:hypothetical protein